MTKATSTEKFDPISSEVVADSPEELEAKRTRLQFAALFDSCRAKARGSDGASISEFTLTRRGGPAQTGLDLGEILAKARPGVADVITINPRTKDENIKRIFYLYQASGNKSLTTFFEAEYDLEGLQKAKLWQEIRNGDDVKAKILRVDDAGHFEDIHITKDSKKSAGANIEDCRPDLTVVSETITEAPKVAVRHTTREFDRVEDPSKVNIPDEIPAGLLRAAAFGVTHRGQGLEIAA